MYIHFEPILKNLYSNFTNLDEEKKEVLLENEALKYQNLINNYYDSLSKELFNVENHCFEMKTEAVISSAYFRAPRRYAQWIKRKEGTPTDEIDVKGLEFKKTNFPELFGDFVESILEKILKGEEKPFIDEQILKFKEDLLKGKFSIEEIGNPTSIKTLNSYLESLPKKGEIFSKTKLRAPAPVKASFVYNDLIKYWGLKGEEYNYLVQGDKILWVYLKDNPFKVEAIAFMKGLIPKKIQEFIIKNINYEKIFDSILLNKIKGLYGDLGWGLNLNPHVNKFFTF